MHKDHEKLFRSLISFGHDSYGDPINRLATNGKISDVACAYILMWLAQLPALKAAYNEQYQRIVELGIECGLSVLSDKLTHPGIPSNVPLLLSDPMQTLPTTTHLPLARYYHPLANTQQAWNIYQRIVNVPCHRDIAHVTDNTIKDAILYTLSLSKL